jgi:hypothetical protein
MRLCSPWHPGRWLVLVPFVLVGLPGCGGSTGTVTGKVSYKGTLLKGGNITFLGEEGKGSMSAPIGEDGSYKLDRVPVGEAKITVETDSLRRRTMAPSYQAPPDAPKSAGSAGISAEEAQRRFVEIPKVYDDPAQTTLKYTVKAGRQEFDVKLE